MSNTRMTQHPFIALAPIAAAVLLAACQTAAPAAEEAAAPNPPAFVEAACGGCHAVEPPFLSPNPRAPSFEAIANRDGLTEDTIADWLANAHNYPEVMDFDLEREQIDQVAEYMITLRRSDYVPEN